MGIIIKSFPQELREPLRGGRREKVYEPEAMEDTKKQSLLNQQDKSSHHLSHTEAAWTGIHGSASGPSCIYYLFKFSVLRGFLNVCEWVSCLLHLSDAFSSVWLVQFQCDRFCWILVHLILLYFIVITQKPIPSFLFYRTKVLLKINAGSRNSSKNGDMTIDVDTH